VSGEPQVLLPIKGLLGLAGLAGRLANPNFAGKAPPEVVAECRANLAEAQAQTEAGAGAVGGVGVRCERLNRSRDAVGAAELSHRWHLLEGPMSAPTSRVTLSPPDPRSAHRPRPAR
jgi:hypothetical protein